MNSKQLSFNVLRFGLLVLFFFAAPVAHAATLTIQSDHLDVWDDKQQALFTGSVHLVRDDFELFSDSLRAFYKSEKEGGGIDHALAIGHVRLLQGGKRGSADRALINNRKQIVTLKGHAVMEQEGGRIEGDIIVHDIVAKTTEVRQGKNGRVRLRIDDTHSALDTHTDGQAGGQLKKKPVDVVPASEISGAKPEDVTEQAQP